MLSIRELVKVYPGPVAALKGVDLDLETGMFGLLGPNGAGKSTLMKIVAGLLEATSGRVELEGVDVTANPRYAWQRLGYLPQDFGFYPNLRGRDMLMHLLRLKGVRAPGGVRKLSGELLERVNLADAAKRRVGGYSGGMMQRLGIAQAIAGDPSILIVDEPTAGLDPEERLRFYHILAELAQDRIVLLSTHIVEDVSVLCPRFAIIQQGRLVARTTPTEARRTVAGTIFQGLCDADDMEDFKSRHVVLQALPFEGRRRLRIHEPSSQAPDGFDPVEATLEDAYLTTMRNGRAPASAPDQAEAVGGAA